MDRMEKGCYHQRVEFLSTHSFPFYFATAVFFTFVVLLLRRRRGKGVLPLPPGPAGLPVVGSLFSLDTELHTYFVAMARTYGPIFSIRLGGKLGVVISSPENAREVLRDQDSIFANRDVPVTAHVIAYGASDIVWNPNGPVWRMLRKVCVREMLSSTGLDAVYDLRRREVRAMVRHLREEAGKPIDVGAQMFLTVMNVITSTLWGGLVEEEDGRRSVTGKEFREVVAEITELLGKPNLSDFFPALAKFDLQGMSKKMGELKVRFDAIFEVIIQKRKMLSTTTSGSKDFLDYMLRLEREGGEDNNTPFTMTHVKALLMDMVVGGTETTSNTTEWAMAEMLNRPESLRRAQEELDEVVGESGVVEESHIPKLPYLSAVIKEVLRLHPALPLLVPHCPSSSTSLAGFSVPKGSRVFVNVWAIQRDPSLWERPSEFLPERFLEQEWMTKWDEFAVKKLVYLPFGSGRRICAGIAMAERMTGYLLASLVHSFDWKAAAELDLAEKFGIVLKKAKPLVAVPTPRLSAEERYDA